MFSFRCRLFDSEIQMSHYNFPVKSFPYTTCRRNERLRKIPHLTVNPLDTEGNKDFHLNIPNALAVKLTPLKACIQCAEENIDQLQIEERAIHLSLPLYLQI